MKDSTALCAHLLLATGPNFHRAWFLLVPPIISGGEMALFETAAWPIGHGAGCASPMALSADAYHPADVVIEVQSTDPIETRLVSNVWRPSTRIADHKRSDPAACIVRDADIRRIITQRWTNRGTVSDVAHLQRLFVPAAGWLLTYPESLKRNWN